MSDTHEFNLKATRCPEAMTCVRSALERALSSGFGGKIAISTIEPSMNRDLSFFVNTQCDGKVTIESVKSTPITDEIKQEWIDTDEAIDDDLVNIIEITTFNVIINSQ